MRRRRHNQTNRKKKTSEQTRHISRGVEQEKEEATFKIKLKQQHVKICVESDGCNQQRDNTKVKQPATTEKTETQSRTGNPEGRGFWEASTKPSNQVLELSSTELEASRHRWQVEYGVYGLSAKVIPNESSRARRTVITMESVRWLNFTLHTGASVPRPWVQTETRSAAIFLRTEVETKFRAALSTQND